MGRSDIIILKWIGLTIYGLGYGFSIGWPLFIVIRMASREMQPDDLLPSIGLWFVVALVTTIVGQLTLGRPRPTVGSIYLLRKFLR